MCRFPDLPDHSGYGKKGMSFLFHPYTLVDLFRSPGTGGQT
jgi:hypothetical protein